MSHVLINSDAECVYSLPSNYVIENGWSSLFSSTDSLMFCIWKLYSFSVRNAYYSNVSRPVEEDVSQ